MSDNHDEPTVLDGPDQTRMFHMMQLRSALALELRSGMKFSNRGNLAAHAIKCGYTQFDKDNPPARMTAAIKRDVYKQLDARIIEFGGQARPLDESK